MPMEVKIISSEFIKPSFPTPDFKKIYKISLLDQFVHPVYVSMLLFYPAKSGTLCYDQSQALKQSLSQVLALYYPLAGKMNDALSVNCNDDGAYFVSATAQLDLSDYLQDPNHSSFPKFMPKENVFGAVKLEDPLVMIQQTTFSCGGIAIGICVSHVICDAISVSAFIKSWAAIARGCSDEALFPDYTAPTLFLQDEGLSRNLNADSLSNLIAKNTKPVVRRFVFDGSVMSTLKSITKSSSVPNPTRVECVSAVLFRSIRLAMKESSTALMSNSVNIRRRAVPPLEESCVGNFVWLINLPLECNETDLSGFVIRMREAVSAVNNDLVKSFQGEKGKERMDVGLEEFHKSFANGTDNIAFTSWCNIGLNRSADFGWGKPLWIPFVGMRNFSQASGVVLMDAEDGNGGGIEAWLSFDEDIMSIVGNDMQRLSFAKLNPSPLHLGMVLSL